MTIKSIKKTAKKIRNKSSKSKKVVQVESAKSIRIK